MPYEQDVQMGKQRVQNAIITHFKGIPLRFEWSDDAGNKEYELRAINSVTDEMFLAKKFSGADLADWQCGALEYRISLDARTWKGVFGRNR